MKLYARYLLVVATGILLTAVAAYLAGFIAAVPIPRVSAQFRHDHGPLFLVLLDIAGAVPLGILAWIVGRILFRAMGTSSSQLWMLAALPWIVYTVAGAIDYVRTSGYSFQIALSVVLGWPSLPSLLASAMTVPIGLWHASKANGGRTLVAP